MKEIELIMIAGYVLGGILGFFLALSPLFIWIHVSKMRKEIKDGRNALWQKLSVLSNEAQAANARLEEMQQRYLKTMQYVCDRLADICDRLGATDAKV